MKNVFLLGIIEPDQELQTHLRKVFLEAGYRIKITSSGTEAIQMLEQRQRSGSPQFDLIITEQHLEDITGIEIIRRVRALCHETKTVLMTNYDVNNCIDIAIKEQLGSIIAKTKPLKVHELLHTAHALLTGDIFGLEKHLHNDALINTFHLSHSDQKDEIIRTIAYKAAEVAKDGDEARDVVGLALDEMISNALYGGPRDENGAFKYEKGSTVTLPVDESIEIKFGYDKIHFGFSVCDSFGTLERIDVLHALSRHTHGIGMDEDSGGAGLYLIRSFIDHFIINIGLGTRTETIGLLALAQNRESAEMMNKSLLIFQTNGVQYD